jgi:hypothetical protein
MNNKPLYILYIMSFFSILIPTTLFLFSTDPPKSAIPRVSIIVVEPMYGDRVYPVQTTDPNSPANCINDLLNNLQEGNLDLNALQEGMAKCFGLNSNNGGDNNTQIIPQPPNASTPRFV